MTRSKNPVSVKTLEDRLGTYIAYCDFDKHPGIIINNKKCNERECNHYRKLYIKYNLDKIK